MPIAFGGSKRLKHRFRLFPILGPGPFFGMSNFVRNDPSGVLSSDGRDDPALFQSDGPRPHVIEGCQVNAIVGIGPHEKLGDMLAAIADTFDDFNVTFPEEACRRLRIPHLVLPKRIGVLPVPPDLVFKIPQAVIVQPLGRPIV